jgi:hypothetical protein
MLRLDLQLEGGALTYRRILDGYVRNGSVTHAPNGKRRRA